MNRELAGSVSERRQVIRVFIGSPSDLNDERAIIPHVVDEVNRIKAHSIGYHFEAVGWEDTLPGRGRPQDRINKDLDTAQLAVMILWRRWGSPTGTHSSGFLEEFEHCHQRKTPLLLYFKRIPAEALADPGPQLRAVLEFQERVMREKTVLFSTFDTPAAFEIQLRQHLSKWLDEHDAGIVPEEMLIRPGAWLRALARDEEQSRRLIARVMATAEQHERVADILANEGDWRLVAGATQRAEYLYKTALELYPSIEAMQGYQHLLIKTGRSDEIKPLQSALRAIADEDQNIRAEIFALEGEGNVAQYQGDLVTAKRCFERTAKLAGDMELFDTACTALTHLGEIARMQGEFGLALRRLNEAIEIGKAEDPRHRVAAMSHRINLLIQAGRYDLARKPAEEALDESTRHNIVHDMSVAKMCIALIDSHDGRTSEATRGMTQALELARRSGETGLEYTILHNLGVVHLSAEEFPEAERIFKDALKLAKERGGLEGISDISFNLGQCAMITGKDAEAREHFHRALHGYQQLGDPRRIKLASDVLSSLGD